MARRKSGITLERHAIKNPEQKLRPINRIAALVVGRGAESSTKVKKRSTGTSGDNQSANNRCSQCGFLFTDNQFKKHPPRCKGQESNQAPDPLGLLVKMRDREKTRRSKG